LITNKISYKQKTIRKEVGIEGVSLFTGETVSIKLKPLDENRGMVFKRKDLPGEPEIVANLSSVKKTPRCTVIGNDKFSILTVEHLLSAFYAFEIDNILIEIYGAEIPACDGSSTAFVDLIEKAQIKEQKENKKIAKIKKPIFLVKDQVHIIALPAENYKISYLLNYPSSKILKSQYYTFVVDPVSYKEEIAPARTFSLYEEIEPLLKKGLIKGGGLNNAVIIKKDKILNPDGIRFLDEMARHKILDLIGDFSLIGKKLFCHVIAIRSGHFSNISFAKKIEKELKEN